MRWVLAVLLAVGCTAEEEPTPPVDACPDPIDGVVRFTEEGQLRGLSRALEPTGFQGEYPTNMAALIAEDLDADGDIDLLTSRRGESATVYENHGAGGFTARPSPTLPPEFGDPTFLCAAVDFDGDDLPELLLWDEGRILRAANEGGLQWGPFETLWSSVSLGDLWVPGTISVADADGDGDLDLAVAGSHTIPDGKGDPDASIDNWVPDLLLLQDASGAFEVVAELTPAGVPSPTQVALFTDRDGDGDQDLLMGVDRGIYLEPTAFWRNDGNDDDGVPVLVNDAPEQGADLRLSAMGVAVADLDEDGLYDYCMTDIGAVKCLLSAGGGEYVEGGRSMGLSATSVDSPERWSGWSIELVDLDNDGDLDAVAAGGDPGPEEPGENDPAKLDHPNVLWEGDGGQFVDVSDAQDFGNTADAYGLAAADVDGDGWLDLVTFSLQGPPELWMNRCGTGHWIELLLRGLPQNSMALGARVEVSYGGRVDLTEVTGLRSRGQSPTRVHVGLGSLEEAEVRIVWPDGAVSELSPAIDQLTEVPHPGR